MPEAPGQAFRWRFGSVLAAAAALRIATLTVAQRHLHSDEAIIGLMARHIAQGREFPVYFYGQTFNGGAALEAWLAAPLFLAFGPSVLALKAVVVVLSLASLLVFALFVRRFFGERVALMAALLFAFVPTLAAWHYQVRGGYGEEFLLALAFLWALFDLAEHGARARTRSAVIFGLSAGLGLWCFELLLPIFAFGLLLLVAAYPPALSGRRAFGAAAAFLAGYAPALVYNLATGGANWRGIFAQRLSTGGQPAIRSATEFWEILSFELPRFFGRETVLWYQPEATVTGWLFYTFFFVTTLVVLRAERNRLLALGAALARRRAVEFAELRGALVLVLLAASALPYLWVGIRVPGYLLGTLPFLCILAALALRQSAAGLAVALVLATVGALASLPLAQHDRFESLTLGPHGLAPFRYEGADFDAALSYLKEEQIDAVVASPSLQYPLIFASDEAIAATSRPLPWHYSVYRPYDEAAAQRLQGWPVFVLETHSPFVPRARAETERISSGPVRLAEFGDITVIHPARPRRAAGDER